MKSKVIAIISLLIIFTLTLGGCFLPIPTDEVIASLGKYSDEEYYITDGFQDYTVYAKYKYEDVKLDDNPYLQPITKESCKDFIKCLENFEGWISLYKEEGVESEIVEGYDFSIDLITDDDYLYIYKDPFYDDMGHYNVYFFDMGTSTLFYFHNNI